MPALDVALAVRVLVDVALVALTLEAAWLVARRRRDGRGLRPLDLLGHLAAGAFLLLALRVAIRGGPAPLVLAFLAASLPAHLFDLARRAREARR